MECIKLTLSPHGTGMYHYLCASNIEMDILANFLTGDIGCNGKIYKEWALADKEAPNTKFNYSCSGNITYLEEENDYIYLSDNSSDPGPERLKLPREQFIQLLDDWWEKVCKREPKEVTIKHANNQFVIETID